MAVRAGEAQKSWFRSDRYYHTDQGWWFLTRENGEQGPFVSQKDAEQEFCLYLRNLRVFEGLFEHSPAQKKDK